VPAEDGRDEQHGNGGARFSHKKNASPQRHKEHKGNTKKK
jgi:hypothetical protein